MLTKSNDTNKAQCELVPTEARLELHCKGFKPFYLDFLSDEMAYRLKRVTRSNELLAKAIGLPGNDSLTVLDATAGFGRDAIILHHLGCRLSLVERSSVVAELLQDALSRAGLDIPLHCGDAVNFINTISSENAPDVIYLDPMFPEKTKTALAGKEMQIMKLIADEEDNAEELLKAAIPHAKKRVVLKRPKHAPVILKPDHQYLGTSTRFDVYRRSN